MRTSEHRFLIENFYISSSQEKKHESHELRSTLHECFSSFFFVFFFFFVGLRSGWGTTSVNVAFSHDGMIWERYSGNPLTPPGNHLGGMQPWVTHDVDAGCWYLFTTHPNWTGVTIRRYVVAVCCCCCCCGFFFLCVYLVVLRRTIYVCAQVH